MKKYVKCITNGFVSITFGRIYEVVKFTPNLTGVRGGGTYTVITDIKTNCAYYADVFEPVQCPCNIKNCIKHRVKQ
jgi:hypothetical protein